MDYCQVQRLINRIGGSKEFPAYSDTESYYPHDRLTKYGFGEWSDMAPHLHRGKDYRKEYPSRPGVYAISVAQGIHTTQSDWEFTAAHLLYIGCSRNILKRLSDPFHHLHRCVSKFDKEHQVVIVQVLLTKDYLWAEKSLIRTLRPWLNIQHNG